MKYHTIDYEQKEPKFQVNEEKLKMMMDGEAVKLSNIVTTFTSLPNAVYSLLIITVYLLFIFYS